MAKQQKLKPISIPEAAELFPESKAYAFQIGNKDIDTSYFMIEKPVFNPTPNVRSLVKCIKFNRKTGYLVVTTVPIRNEDEIKALTIKQWYDLVEAKITELVNNPNEREKLIPYEAMGFYKGPKPLKVVGKTPKEVLPKPNESLGNPEEME